MTKIKNYILNSEPSLTDKLIGTDVSQSNFTKNFSLNDVSDLIISQIPTLSNSNILISGGVSWVEGLTYDVSELTYYINGVYVTTEPTQVTLNDGDPTNPRLDVIYATIDGDVGVHTGTPSPSPVRPRVFSSTQILVSFVLVNSGATTPEGVEAFIVYDENTGLPNEFNASSSISDGSIDFNDTLFPYVGSKCISLKSVQDEEWISFKTSSPYNISDISTLSFQLAYMTVPNQNATLVFSVWNSGNVISNEVAVAPGSFGANGNISNAYQLIVLPFNDFVFNSNTFDEIRIDVKGISDITIRLDYIRILSGINNAPLQGTYLSLSDTDESYVGKSGFVPSVRDNESGMDLVSINGKKVFRSSLNQTDFTFLSTDIPFTPRMVFVDEQFKLGWTYNTVTTTLTMDAPVGNGVDVTLIQ